VEKYDSFNINRSGRNRWILMLNDREVEVDSWQILNMAQRMIAEVSTSVATLDQNGERVR
jgi:hypothetical protein